MRLQRSGLLRRPLVAAVLGLVLVALVLALTIEGRRLDSLYWHDVTLDHHYDFAQSRAFTIDVGTNELVVPGAARAAHTLLLELDVEAGIVGRWIEPWLAISGPGTAETRQYFERGARGRRYVLLPGADGLEGQLRLSLRGGHLHWRSGSARLHAFFEETLALGPVLVLAPHPDDAEIAAFDLYASTDSWIVTISCGNGMDRRMQGLVTEPAAISRLKGELRSWDSVAIPQWAGVPADRAVNLGYFTLSLAAMYAHPEAPFEDELLGSADISPFRRTTHSELLDREGFSSTWSSLVEDLRHAVTQIDPRTILAPHPALDGAMDHKLATIALFEALDGLPDADRRLLLYDNHHQSSEYYPFGPAGALMSPPPWTQEPLWARQIYSRAVDPTQRLRKLYALEAQHDLRPPPAWVDARPLRQIVRRIDIGVRELLRDPTETYSYMRRAARPNELFYVYRQSDAAMLRATVESALTKLRSEGVALPQNDY